MRETWKPVIGYGSFYEISDLGRIKSLRQHNRIMKPWPVTGYPTVCLCGPTGQKNKAVHIIVAIAFIGPVPEGKEVHHKNENRGDPRLENLEYVTRQENIQRSIAHYRGPFNASSKLSVAEIREIRALYPTTPGSVLAKKFNVKRATIYAVAARRRWGYID